MGRSIHINTTKVHWLHGLRMVGTPRELAAKSMEISVYCYSTFLILFILSIMYKGFSS